MTHVNPTDEKIREILEGGRTIAVVGASAKAVRPSHGVMQYLQGAGYRILPVNPGLSGQTLLGECVAADLADLEPPVDIVDVFRNPQAALEAVRAAIREKERLSISTVWLQIGVINEQAAQEAADAGLNVVMDRCLKIEVARLLP